MFSQVCVILFTGGGVCLSACWDTTPPQSRPSGSRHPPNSRHPPRNRHDPPQSRHPWEQTPPGSRHPPQQTPTQKAHTQGGNWGGSGPGPHPRGKLRGIRSRSTPKGEIEGDQIQAHTQGGNWGGSDPGPHPRGKLRGMRCNTPPPPEHAGDTVNARAVRILLECSLLTNDNGWNVRLPSVAQNAHGVIF